MDKMRVNVYGAGIAGLTVAHELAERGYRVRVVESDRGFGAGGASRIAIGGLARTQYARRSGLSGGAESRFSPEMEGGDERRLPGEHGFRFFPSYYRHVFDTMRRIPVRDAQGNETGRTVHDNVVPTPSQILFSPGAAPVTMPRTPAASGDELRRRFEALLGLGYQPRDILQFLLRLLRYMSTCSKRRAAELESISWWEYLEGRNHKTGKAVFRYSARFEEDTKQSPRVLAAFDCIWGDARTCGNTAVQLFYNWIKTLPKTDGVLNGPTSEAWFDPWQEHLRRLGVELVQGRLERLVLDQNGALTALVGLGEGSVVQPDAPADYYVVATDVATAERVTCELPALGVAAGLRGYTTLVKPSPDGVPEPRVAPRRYGLRPWDRLQVMTGIQYYFMSDFRLGDGHAYFNQSPWGLTAIQSPQFWAKKPIPSQDGYASLLSVDLCAADGRAADGRSMWQCRADELAMETWRQMCASIPPELKPPQPTHYHLDEFLEFHSQTGVLEGSRAGYLIPIKNEWRLRPGADPGRYQVHFGALVFAGTYLKTFTRMTTMEAANESARHAVNAILDNQHGARRCETWDLEREELRELAPAKLHDEWCFERGLPHPWDLFGVEAVIDIVARLIQPDSPGGGVLGLLRSALSALNSKT